MVGCILNKNTNTKIKNDILTHMKLKQYFTALQSTLTQPDYYLEILNQNVWSSVKFLLISYLLIGLLVSLIIVQVDIPKYQSQFAQAMEELKTNYPPRLEIKWENNQLTTNSPEPVKVNYPSVVEPKYRLQENLALINPQLDTPGENEPAFFIFSQDKLWFQDNAQSWNQLPLTAIPGFQNPLVINHQSLDTVIQGWQQTVTSILTKLKFLVPIFFPVLLLLSRLIANIIDVLLIFLMSRISFRKFSFPKIWQISLHVMVVAEIVSQITGYLYPHLNLQMYSITYWVWFAAVLFKLKNVQAVRLPKKNES